MMKSTFFKRKFLRFVSLLACAMILCSVFAGITVCAASYQGVSLNVPYFCQRQYGDCAISSISMVEAYYQGYSSNSDAVYNAVYRSNGNSISIASYAALGYTTVSCDMATVYNYLKSGNPVIVRRLNGSGMSHYSVVYAYTGSTSSLSLSGFSVLNTYRNNNQIFGLERGYTILNLQDWLNENGSYWAETLVRTSQRIQIGYTVSYNANGGSGAPGSQTKYYNQDLTLSSVTPTRSGYTFLGWSTSSTATSATYTAGGRYTANAGATLYAVWKANTTSITSNSSYTASISTAGEKRRFTFTPTISDGYVIYSTNSSSTDPYVRLLNSSGTELAHDDDSAGNNQFLLSYTLTAGNKYTFEIKLYDSSKTGQVRFTFGKVYTLRYDANGGSGAPAAQPKYYNINLLLSNKTPNAKSYTIRYDANGGYVSASSKSVYATFNSWNTSPNGWGTEYLPGEYYSPNADATLYAQWYNPTAGTLATPTRAGHIFEGWYTAPSGGTKVTSSTTITGSTTLYAHWTKTFPDVSSSAWYYDAVMYVTKAGFFSGYQNGTFGVSDPIQRQDFLVALARYSNVNPAVYKGNGGFRDVDANGYYAFAVVWGAGSGITSGYTSGPNAGKFGVGDYITREQLVTFMYRYARLIGVNTSVSTSAAYWRNRYSDFDSVSAFARDAVIWALERGVISGKTVNGRVCIAPQGNAQRCEAAQIFYNIK